MGNELLELFGRFWGVLKWFGGHLGETKRGFSENLVECFRLYYAAYGRQKPIYAGSCDSLVR